MSHQLPAVWCFKCAGSTRTVAEGHRYWARLFWQCLSPACGWKLAAPDDKYPARVGAIALRETAERAKA